MLTSEQVRAARALLRLEQAELASQAGVSIETVRRFEAVDGKVKGREDTIRAVKSALERLGVVFIDEDKSGGCGVRLASPQYMSGAQRIAAIIESAMKQQRASQKDGSTLDIDAVAQAVADSLLPFVVEAGYIADDDGNLTILEPKKAKPSVKGDG